MQAIQKAVNDLESELLSLGSSRSRFLTRLLEEFAALFLPALGHAEPYSEKAPMAGDDEGEREGDRQASKSRKCLYLSSCLVATALIAVASYYILRPASSSDKDAQVRAKGVHMRP
jgi:hypothetical protein